MNRQPTHAAMKRARKMVRDLEALNSFELGPLSWQIIERTFAEHEAAIEKAYESDLGPLTVESNTLRAQLAEAEHQRDALRAALAEIHGIAADYCHNDISAQITYDTDAALNRILKIAALDGPQ